METVHEQVKRVHLFREFWINEGYLYSDFENEETWARALARGPFYPKIQNSNSPVLAPISTIDLECHEDEEKAEEVESVDLLMTEDMNIHMEEAAYKEPGVIFDFKYSFTKGVNLGVLIDSQKDDLDKLTAEEILHLLD